MKKIRKIYIVPNFVTTANIFSGFYSIIASIQGNYVVAAWAIVAAAVFDTLDGRVARLAKATSAFGVQYDSLSDLVSFGVAPAILLYQWALVPYDRLGWIASFLFLTCGALRLARFNVNTDKISGKNFQGLPIPIPAGIVATSVIFYQHMQLTQSPGVYSLILSFVLASLMVSTVPFPSFKELNWRSRASFGFLLIGIFCMVLVAIKPEITLFLVLSSYVCLSLIWNVLSWVCPSIFKNKFSEDSDAKNT